MIVEFAFTHGASVKIKGTEIGGRVIGLYVDLSGGIQIQVRYMDGKNSFTTAYFAEDELEDASNGSPHLVPPPGGP